MQLSRGPRTGSRSSDGHAPRAVGQGAGPRGRLDDLPRVVLVTGASSGIGRATALRLARPGAVLALVARGRQGLDAVATDCRARGADGEVHALDVGDDAAVGRAVADVVRRHGRLDAVVHSAATIAYGDVVDVPVETFDAVVRTDVLGSVNVARHAVRQLRAQADARPGDGGTVVLLGSLLGHIAAPWMGSYTVSKWAVRGLARTLVVENRPYPGIQVRLVSPGGVETPVYRRAATFIGRHGKPPFPVYAPETVAERVVGTLARPRAARRDQQVGWANPVVIAGFTALPGVFDTLVRPLLRVFGLDGRTVATTTGNVHTPSDRSDPTGDDAPRRRRTRDSR